MSPTREYRSINVQFEKGDARDETLLGKNYVVYPVVAMVEGVRFGAGQTQPELGLVSEFGDTPITWANRPLVLNHPQVEGVFVSANIPAIIQAYQFGVTMNPEVKDGKLHMEAWIDVARVESLGGDFQDTLDRIEAGEEVEVSVGFFCEVEEKKGKFKGQSYGAIWRNIKPDHLAILSEGQIGACSVEAGCGIPRINEDGSMSTQPVKTTKPTDQTTTTDPKAQCSCGGTHTQEEHTEDDDKPVTQKGLKSMIADLLKPFTQSKEEKVLETHVSSGQRARNEALVLNAQMIDPTLMNRDIYALISKALSKEYGANTYLLGYTQEVAVYEAYNPGSMNYLCYQIGIEVDPTSCKFVGEPAEVILQTKIVPQTTTTGENTTVTQKENDMADDKTKEGTTTTTQAATPEQKTQTEAPKVMTEAEYIANAPPGVREALEASMRTHTVQKNKAIEAIKAHKGNKWTDDDLKAMSLDQLDKVLSMAPANYSGVASGTSVSVQEQGGLKDTVPVVKAFVRKTEQAA